MNGKDSDQQTVFGLGEFQGRANAGSASICCNVCLLPSVIKCHKFVNLIGTFVTLPCKKMYHSFYMCSGLDHIQCNILCPIMYSGTPSWYP